MIYDFLEIDRESSNLLYEQLYEKIIKAISEKELVKGDKLPSIRHLSESLNISRTTVQTAYDQLCAEGYINNAPKKGYFIEADTQIVSAETVHNPTQKNTVIENAPVVFDFSSSGIDPNYIDMKYWRRCVSEILTRQNEVSSYGDPQGELELRKALCSYSKNVRGTNISPNRIIIGAGTQALLSVLLGICTEYGKDAAIEKGFFPQGEQIFKDHSFSMTALKADKNGIILDDTVKSRILFINSSGSIRGSAPLSINKRSEIIAWANSHDAIIIEDDYNGELRYTSKPIPALQGLCSDRVVYIGSFSKLLLPSVRIGYMIIPDILTDRYNQCGNYYNQTSSKIEQLALAEYINAGRLYKQLRKLRKIYAQKSDILSSSIKTHFGQSVMIDIIETALCVRIKLRSDKSLDWHIGQALQNGIKLGKCREKNGVKYFYLSFSGISAENIDNAVIALKKAWQ